MLWLIINEAKFFIVYSNKNKLISQLVTQTCQPLVRADDTKNPDLSGAGYDKFGIKKRGWTP